MKTQLGSFDQTIPLTLIKGKDSAGNSIVKFEGIASKKKRDFDGEYLDPAGFQSEWFLKNGFFNWNHDKSPNSYIGKPTKAELSESGEEYIVGGYLFGESVRAQQVIELQGILKAQGLELGLSIEGQVLERGSNDKNNPAYNIIKRANITGCAITPTPKCEGTTMEIIKSHNFNELSAYDHEDEETKEKAMSAGSESGAAISKESLDDSIKDLTQNTEGENKLKKSEVYGRLLGDLHSYSGDDITKVYNLIEKIQKSIDMKNINVKGISPEAFAKAYEVLGISPGEAVVEKAVVAKDIQGETSDIVVGEQKSYTQAELAEAKDLLLKGLEALEAVEVIEDSATIEKSVEEVIAEEVVEETSVEEVEEVEDVVEKAVISENQSDEDVLLKGISDLIGKSNSKLSETMSTKFQAMGRISKGINEKVDSLQERLKILETSSPTPKSVIGAPNYIEKSFEGESGSSESIPEGMKVMSVSRDKRAICDTLTKAVTEGDQITNRSGANDISLFEMSGTVSKGLISLASENGIKIVQ